MQKEERKNEIFEISRTLFKDVIPLVSRVCRATCLNSSNLTNSQESRRFRWDRKKDNLVRMRGFSSRGNLMMVLVVIRLVSLLFVLSRISMSRSFVELPLTGDRANLASCRPDLVLLIVKLSRVTLSNRGNASVLTSFLFDPSPAKQRGNSCLSTCKKDLQMFEHLYLCNWLCIFYFLEQTANGNWTKVPFIF